MTGKELDKRGTEELEFYMDLLGHDMLNNNQAVLSYLELILSNRDLDPKVRKYAEKAASQIRASAVLIETIKRAVGVMKGGLSTQGPLDLGMALKRTGDDLARLFPDRQLTIRMPEATGTMLVSGNGVVEDILLNMMVNMVQLDPGNRIDIKISADECRHEGVPCFRIRIEDTGAQIPPSLAKDIGTGLDPEDRSKAVKMTGLLFAHMMAEAIKAQIEVEDLSAKGMKEGGAFTIVLRRWEQP
jgi:signal transduction histidine kinase